MSKASEILEVKEVRNFSDFDRSLVKGNQLDINVALQKLEKAQKNLKNLEKKGYSSNLESAIKLITEYNKKVSKDLGAEK